MAPVSPPSDFLAIMSTINIYRWIYIQNVPWLLSMRSSNYLPVEEMKMGSLDGDKCNGQTGVICNTLPQAAMGTTASGATSRTTQRNATAADYASTTAFLTQINQTMARAKSTLSLKNSSGSLGGTGTHDESSVELQIILTNNQDRIYSSCLTFEDLCQHREDTFLHSEMQWHDYFSLLVDPTSSVSVKTEDSDLWVIALKGKSTSMDSNTASTGQNSSTGSNHIRFEYELCKLADEDMRRDAMQYLLFALVGMVETQQLQMKQLQFQNQQLQQKLKERPVLEDQKNIGMTKSSKTSFDTVKLKRKRTHHPLSTLRPFKRAKKARGALIA